MDEASSLVSVTRKQLRGEALLVPPGRCLRRLKSIPSVSVACVTADFPYHNLMTSRYVAY
jgi:hypothetical protein